MAEPEQPEVAVAQRFEGAQAQQRGELIAIGSRRLSLRAFRSVAFLLACG